MFGWWLSVVGSFVWKTIPSVARVTRDAVSGIKKVRESCLEDSTTLLCSLALGSLAMFKNLSRITQMRRICSFTDFYCVLLDLSAPVGRWDFHGLSLAGGNPAPYRRKYNP